MKLTVAIPDKWHIEALKEMMRGEPWEPEKAFFHEDNSRVLLDEAGKVVGGAYFERDGEVGEIKFLKSEVKHEGGGSMLLNEVLGHLFRRVELVHMTPKGMDPGLIMFCKKNGFKPYFAGRMAIGRDAWHIHKAGREFKI